MSCVPFRFRNVAVVCLAVIALAWFASWGTTQDSVRKPAAPDSKRGADGPTPLVIASFTGKGPDGKFPSVDPAHRAPVGVKEFELSQEFPKAYDAKEVFPWDKIDFARDSEKYLRSVLKYCLEGNKEVEFRGQENKVRKWYHAPWLHDDSDPNKAGGGREYHHGLTRERRSRPKELHPNQTERAQNWAIGMLNARGGYILGQVWNSPSGYPDPTRASFPPNTVSFKLLFTNASDKQVPYIKNSYSWQANIYKDTNKYAFPREDQTVRLLQIDIAVKEPRAGDRSGWIFGTFAYDGSFPGNDPFDRLQFVGLSWGDDDDVKEEMERAGAFKNPKLKETVLNESLLHPAGPDQMTMHHFGLGGRLNGPVDSPVSSCISCHGRAATIALSGSDYDLNKSGTPMPSTAKLNGEDFTDPAKYPKDEFSRFFRTLPPGSHLETDEGDLYVTTDYCLQIPGAIRNYYEYIKKNEDVRDQFRKQMIGSAAKIPRNRTLLPLPKLERGEARDVLTGELYVVSWNVENLFDAIDDPDEDDDDFTPEGANRYTEDRYKQHLKNLSSVLRKMNDQKGPDVLGLAEVENRTVLKDLIAEAAIPGRDYRIVHKDSPSHRGIDCAIIYDANRVSLRQETFHFVDAGDTRDIVEGEFTVGGKALTVFMNHWPSRSNAESQRITAATTLRKRVDAILRLNPKADIVIMGDLNDYPSSPSVKTHLRAVETAPPNVAGDLVDTMWKIVRENKGTYVFDNQWEAIDHVIISAGLFDSDGFTWKQTDVVTFPEQIFTPANAKQIPRPNRLYQGVQYHPTGVSDHLPVFCILKY